MEALLSKKEIDIINDLAKSERLASNTYEYFANCMRTHGMFGATKFFMAESKSELDHYEMVAKFMNDMGVEIKMPSIESIDFESEGLGDILEMAYDMEKDLLDSYCEAYEAVSVKAKIFIQKMIDIQISSVGEYGDLIQRFALVGDNVLLFDQELGDGL